MVQATVDSYAALVGCRKIRVVQGRGTCPTASWGTTPGQPRCSSLTNPVPPVTPGGISERRRSTSPGRGAPSPPSSSSHRARCATVRAATMCCSVWAASTRVWTASTVGSPLGPPRQTSGRTPGRPGGWQLGQPTCPAHRRDALRTEAAVPEHHL